MFRFNSSMVQLLGSRPTAYMGCHWAFQFQYGAIIRPLHKSLFSSIKKFQFQYGAIIRGGAYAEDAGIYGVSIPVWCNY